MGFEDLSFYGRDGISYCFNLIEDIDAVLFIFYHFCDSAKLSFNSTETGQLCLVARVAHWLDHSGYDVGKDGSK